MFRVKICGITSVDDARSAVEAGADALGLNFYRQSKRYCPVDVASEIVSVVGDSVHTVGVFVNASAEEVRHAFHTLRLDSVQLHGDESPDDLSELRGIPVIKAFRVDGDFSAIGEFTRACHARRCRPRMILIDAAQAGTYGGTGNTLDWQVLAKHRVELAEMPLVLAGGLTPENVAEAIGVVRPWGVDVASGVEASPGRKSVPQMQAFVAAAREAFHRASRWR